MFKIILFFVFALAVSSKEVCFDQLGCFTDKYPFSGTLQRPLAFLPDSPQKINVKFFLHNRKLQNTSEAINYLIIGENFEPTIPTKFIIHGFLHSAKKKWVIDMKNALLDAENVNVITVDWSKGNGFPYTQSTANTQVVGAEIARLITNMIREKGAKATNFHLIGHSLGAHVAGYAGKRVPNIGRITGLDPAGPYFENTDSIVRLDSSDAQYVDVIHSDGTANLLLGLGLFQAIGHADFYPNGGVNQPECPANSDKLLAGLFNIAIMDYEGMEDSLGCSHTAAVYFFIDSIKNPVCEYFAYKCDSKADFDAGKCLKCSEKGCNRMGYYSSLSKEQGSLYLSSQSLQKDSLFCKHSYGATLVSNSKVGSGGLIRARGKFTIYFGTPTGQLSSVEVLDDGKTSFTPESVEVRLVSIDEPLKSEVSSVYVSYQKTSTLLSSWLYDNSWSFKNVIISEEHGQIQNKFCPTENIIESTKTVKFVKC